MASGCFLKIKSIADVPDIVVIPESMLHASLKKRVLLDAENFSITKIQCKIETQNNILKIIFDYFIKSKNTQKRYSFYKLHMIKIKYQIDFFLFFPLE